MRIAWILLILLALQGCSAVSSRQRPVPVEPAVADGAGPVQLVYRTPPPAFRPTPAVQALLERADVQRAAGDLAGAAATLERALRIAPRSPHLWNRMARVRLEQGRFAQADSLAAKSSTLAGDDPALKNDNRRIMAAARRAGRR